MIPVDLLFWSLVLKWTNGTIFPRIIAGRLLQIWAPLLRLGGGGWGGGGGDYQVFLLFVIKLTLVPS